MSFSLRAASLLLSICLLTGCGLKGSLYLPDDKERDDRQPRTQAPANNTPEQSPSATDQQPL